MFGVADSYTKCSKQPPRRGELRYLRFLPSAKTREITMKYHQLTSGDRYSLSALRTQGLNQSQIAKQLGRHRSTISRELKRNCARFDGHYRPSKAIERTSGRRSRSRRNLRFTLEDLHRVNALIRKQWSPQQVSGHLREQRLLASVMRPSIATSGAIRSAGVVCIRIFAAHARIAASATGAMTAGEDWPASDISHKGLRACSSVARSATGRSTR